MLLYISEGKEGKEGKAKICVDDSNWTRMFCTVTPDWNGEVHWIKHSLSWNYVDKS